MPMLREILDGITPVVVIGAGLAGVASVSVAAWMWWGILS